MKKFLLLVLALTMLMLSTAALAAEYNPGDTVTVSFSAGNSSLAGLSGKVTYNSSALTLTSTTAHNLFPFESSSNGSYSGMASSAIGKSGKFLTVTFTVKDSAPAGDYRIGFSVSEAIDADLNDISASVSGGTTVTIVKNACATHTWDEGKVTTEPTCDKDGEVTKTCTVCGATEKAPIKSEGHKWDEGVETTAPTCTDKGVKTFTCSVCKTTKPEEIPAKGHTPSENADKKDPTCTEPGSISYKCTVCNAEVSGEEIPALNHKFDEGTVTKEATCAAEGEKTFKCTNPGCTETKTEKIDKLTTHTWDEGTVTKEPTCTEKGVKTVTCTVCKLTQTEDIDAKGHTPSENADKKEPTCTEPGSISYKCTVCNAEVSGEEIPAKGHSYTDFAVVFPATCDKAGKKTRICTDCGDEDSETIKALGHKYSAFAVTIPATCDTTGTKTRICSVCGDEDSETIAALGHKPGEWVVTKPVTDDEPGEEQQSCTVCNKVLKTRVIPNTVWYHMTVSSIGPRFRDVSSLTRKWNMFTVVDLSKDGEQTFDLVAGNMHVVGKMIVTVANGNVTVDYKLVNSQINVKSEFLSILPDLDSVDTLNAKYLPTYTFGEPISIADALGGDTLVLIYMNNECHYADDTAGLKSFNPDGKAYTQLADAMNELLK